MHYSIYRLPPEERPKKFETDRVGRLRERAFLHAWQDLTHWPKWMIRAPTKASQKDDEHRGIDAYVHTTAGDIPIQVKGSMQDMYQYIKAHGDNHVTIVVVNENDSADAIRAYTFPAIKKGYRIARWRGIKARKTALPPELAIT